MLIFVCLALCLDLFLGRPLRSSDPSLCRVVFSDELFISLIDSTAQPIRITGPGVELFFTPKQFNLHFSSQFEMAADSGGLLSQPFCSCLDQFSADQLQTAPPASVFVAFWASCVPRF